VQAAAFRDFLVHQASLARMVDQANRVRLAQQVFQADLHPTATQSRLRHANHARLVRPVDLAMLALQAIRDQQDHQASLAKMALMEIQARTVHQAGLVSPDRMAKQDHPAKIKKKDQLFPVMLDLLVMMADLGPQASLVPTVHQDKQAVPAKLVRKVHPVQTVNSEPTASPESPVHLAHLARRVLVQSIAHSMAASSSRVVHLAENLDPNYALSFALAYNSNYAILLRTMTSSTYF